MINVTQAVDALIQISGVHDVYETFNKLHTDSFVLMYKDLKCNVSVTNNIITLSLVRGDCTFKRSWAFSKQESETSFMEDVKFFLEDTERKLVA